ncbi:MAG: M48 family metalloprotease [Leptolyngbya sp. SIOISBB]|nr:M48 family metalloprotease [Leptolyngbya sp. SIOISBB]
MKKLLKRCGWMMLGLVLCGLWQSLIVPAIAIAPLPPQPRLLAQGGAAASTAAFVEADQLYRSGDIAAAEEIYRQLKPEFADRAVSQVIEPIYEPASLDSADLAYWDAAQGALANNQTSGAIGALQQLIAAEPGFIAAPLELAQLLQDDDRDSEALEVLEQAATIHPYSSDIVMAQVRALADDGQHLEASIAARSFAILNLDHPQAGEFRAIADDELNAFTSGQNLRNIILAAANLTVETLPDILDGGFLNPGNIFNSSGSILNAAQDIEELVQKVSRAFADESELGALLAEEYKQTLSLVDDPEVVDYVTQLGLEVAQLMGRDFDYEFFVVRDNSLNAFALPGGKVFVNTGAILGTRSQAELAGLMGHEVAHSVLSHGVQKVNTNGLIENLIEPLVAGVPYDSVVTDLLRAQYSQSQERQADILGSRVLASSGYAADGLRNVMATLAEFSSSSQTNSLSTHPASAERVEYLEDLIIANGYNRYALEGVDRHQVIQARL